MTARVDIDAKNAYFFYRDEETSKITDPDRVRFKYRKGMHKSGDFESASFFGGTYISATGEWKSASFTKSYTGYTQALFVDGVERFVWVDGVKTAAFVRDGNVQKVRGAPVFEI